MTGAEAMAENRYDLVVIGAGPGGYVAAIRAAQLGMRTACIDSRGTWGGTCLNVGCIPSKALLHSSHLFDKARRDLADHGITTGEVGLDLAAMMARKDKVVADLCNGIGFLFKKNGVDGIAGTARIAAPGRVEISAGGETTMIETTRILVATGSVPAPLPGIEIDEDRILSSTGALALGEVPGHLIVIGGGYIGLEMGSIWLRLGARVTVIEFLDAIVPGMDAEISRHLHRLLKAQGMEFRLGTRVTGARTADGGVTLDIEPAGGGAAETVAGDAVLVAIGRVPFTDGLGLDELGVRRDERGAILVDEHYATSIEGIHAVGDAIPGAMLAHKAEEEGIACVERMAGMAAHVNYDAIPAVVYTWPEAASVGRTEQQLKDADIDYRSGKFPLAGNSRARTAGETAGFVKILADASSDEVLGAHLLGPDAGTLIAEIALAMEFRASAEDIARTCHAHPTLNEAVKEAALGVGGAAIHV